MKVYTKETFEYVPEWEGNKDEKPEDQIKVTFKFLSAKDLIDTLDDRGIPSVEKQWPIICKEITNLEVNDIKITPDGVYNLDSLAGLYTELITAYKLETNISKKKFK
jgi:hypothetical protein